VTRVAVVVAARDAAALLPDALASVAWADERIVVENDSTDGTLEVARAHGATLAFAHPFGTIGGQRNAAIARATSEWVLVLDADERATAGVEAAVRAAIAAPAADAYRIPRRNVFLGREIRHGGWERDRPVRLFRARFRYDDRPVHERVLLDATPATLPAALTHVPYATLDGYFAKQLRYARDGARAAHARGERCGALAVLTRPAARLVRMLVLRGGWRDGAHGVVLAALAASGVAAKYARLWALSRGLER